MEDLSQALVTNGSTVGIITKIIELRSEKKLSNRIRGPVWVRADWTGENVLYNNIIIKRLLL